MENVETRKAIINITELSSDERKITLNDGKLKYFLWKKKQDGDDTKAFNQFNSLGCQIGKVYEAEVEFEDREFVNDKGKKINYTSRKILYFYTGKETKSAPSSNIEERLNKASEAFKKMQAQLNELEVRVGVIEMAQTQAEQKELNKIPY